MQAHLHHMRLAGMSPATVYARRRILARLAAWLGTDLLAATAADLLAWRESLAPLAADTVAHYVSHTQQFYRWAVASGALASDPSAGLPVSRPRRRLPRPIAEPDLFAALAAADDRVRPWLVLAGWCGLRAKEIALLRRENVLDTADPPALIVAADATKGHAERVVPLCRFALAELHAAGLPRTGWVFRRRDGHAGPVAPHLVSHLANAHLHACGVADTLHSLRHRFGTQAWHASKDLRGVQELLGHAVPQTTAGYTAFDRPAQRAAVEALPVPGLRAVEEGAG